jgi:nucleotide-binding universal stress UspA family protein
MPRARLAPLVVIAGPGVPVPGWVRDWTGDEPAVAVADSRAAVVSAADRGLDGPLLVLRSRVPTTPRRVVAAVQEHAADSPVVEAAVSVTESCGAGLRIVHAVPRSFGERSVGLDAAVERGRRLVGAAARSSAADGELVRAWPHEVLDETLTADLLVIGGLRPPPARHEPAELGLTTRAALLHAPCPVLVVPRAC